MTDNVVPGTFTPIYTSRNRVTRPPMYAHGGPRSPMLLRHLDKVVGFLVPRTKVSFLVPVSRSSFRFLIPRSGSSFLVPVLTYGFITIPLHRRAYITWNAGWHVTAGIPMKLGTAHGVL